MLVLPVTLLSPESSNGYLKYSTPSIVSVAISSPASSIVVHSNLYSVPVSRAIVHFEDRRNTVCQIGIIAFIIYRYLRMFMHNIFCRAAFCARERLFGHVYEFAAEGKTDFTKSSVRQCGFGFIGVRA